MRRHCSSPTSMAYGEQGGARGIPAKIQPGFRSQGRRANRIRQIPPQTHPP